MGTKKMKLFIGASCMVLLLCACVQNAPSWQEQYDLGVRYLSDGNYEEAIIAFTAAIEIDPKNADGYIGMAKAHIAMGDIDAALAVLSQGLNECDNPNAIDAFMETLEEQTKPMDSLTLLLTAGNENDMISAQDITFWGHSFVGLSMDTVKSALNQSKFYYAESSGDGHDWVSGTLKDDPAHIEISAIKYWDEAQVSYVCYDHYTYDHRHNELGASLPVGVRDIYTYDSLTDVLTKLGFINAQEIANAMKNQPLYATHIYSSFGVMMSCERGESTTGDENTIIISFSFDVGENRLGNSFEFKNGYLTEYHISLY